jgi:hypothetical protein
MILICPSISRATAENMRQRCPDRVEARMETTAMDRVEVHSRPTVAEVARARLHLYFSSGRVKLGLAASLALPALYWLGWGTVNAFLALPVGITWILLPFAVTMGGIRSKAIIDLTTYGIRYRLSDAGIGWQFKTANASASGEHDWSHITRARETRDLFLLFAGLVVIPLPKRNVQPGDDLLGLRRLLEKHVSDIALLRNVDGG